MYDSVTKENKIINGVDRDELLGTIEAVKEARALGSFQFRAENRWLDGARNDTTVKDIYGAGQEQPRENPHVMQKDEPVFLLGTDKAANPVEYLLAALAGCLTTTLVFFAAAESIALDEVTSKLEADGTLLGFLGIDETVRMGFDEIRVTFDVKSEAPRERIEALLTLAQSRSGVFDMLTNPTPVSVRLA
jgi:uncharacterized OsmC-like protein